MRLSWRRGAIVVVLAALASGCYESAFPLDPAPVVDVDPALLGTWRCLPLDGDRDDAPATLTATRDTRPRMYDVSWQEDGGASLRYEAYASRLASATFLNVRERRDPEPPSRWFFMRTHLLRPNVLHLQVVADQAMAGVPGTAADVRATLGRRHDDATLYTDAAVCARVGPSK